MLYPGENLEKRLGDDRVLQLQVYNTTEDLNPGTKGGLRAGVEAVLVLNTSRGTQVGTTDYVASHYLTDDEILSAYELIKDESGFEKIRELFDQVVAYGSRTQRRMVALDRRIERAAGI